MQQVNFCRTERIRLGEFWVSRIIFVSEAIRLRVTTVCFIHFMIFSIVCLNCLTPTFIKLRP